MSLLETDIFGTVHDKVQTAIDRVKAFEPPEGYYFADSGGKDSSVVRQILINSGVRFDAHYCVTTMDPPELCHFLRENHPDTKWDFPEKPFLKELLNRGFPLRQNRWCCSEYKERGGSGRIVVTGIRKEESKKRAGRKMVERCFKDVSKTYLHPIIDWTFADVWQFIREENIPYCELYDEGFKRLGCVMCCYNHSRAFEGERWPGIKKKFIQAFERLHENNKARPSYSRWKNGREMFDWWLSHNGGKVDPDQTVMFE